VVSCDFCGGYDRFLYGTTGPAHTKIMEEGKLGGCCEFCNETTHQPSQIYHSAQWLEIRNPWDLIPWTIDHWL
jgi:hypothetical protein